MALLLKYNPRSAVSANFREDKYSSTITAPTLSLWLMSGSPAAAQAHHWWPRVQKKSRMELLLHLSSVIQEKHSLIDPYMAPVASLRFQHGRCCWVLNQPQCDTSVKEVLHTRWAFKYSFLCSNVTVLIINTADARWSIVDFINNLTLKTKPRKERTCRTAPLSLVFYQR